MTVEIGQQHFPVENPLHIFGDKVLSFGLTRYSSSTGDADCPCLPNLQQYHRFLISILAGTYATASVMDNQLYPDAVCFHNRGNAIKVILSKRIVSEIEDAREQQSSTSTVAASGFS
ncbi:unnamed protein product [Gongylonema pulchrum]|uniref:Uncharacterized protein n=1 Tax=Gongylonema pulchrum TaxID=637853 RepID=A0A183D3K9_9BILA|nr:unnamed protein product [Gongylonema pulchrum]